jgi:hypothetical protein
MDRPSPERLAENRRRLAIARQSHIDVLQRLADTEDEVALTFEHLARDGANKDRRAALAREARQQAARLRSYLADL